MLHVRSAGGITTETTQSDRRTDGRHGAHSIMKPRTTQSQRAPAHHNMCLLVTEQVHVRSATSPINEMKQNRTDDTAHTAC